jgi:putative transcriptional regulator
MKRNRASEDDFFEGKTFGEVLVSGFREFADALEENPRSISKKFTCHRIRLNLRPTNYNAKLVKTTRAVLGASQAIFAQFLGVSVQTVRAWEQGINIPQDAACRLMDEIRRDPDYWQRRLQSLIVKKSSGAKA